MTEAPRVLVLIDAHVGHINATLRLSEMLLQTGARLIYSGPPEAGPTVRSAGFVFEPLSSINLDRSDGAELPESATVRFRRRLSARRRITTKVRAIRAEISTLISSTKPDLVIVDPFLLVFYPFLWAEGVVVVALSTKPLFRRSSLTPPYTSRLVPKSTRWGRIRVLLSWLRQWIEYGTYRCRTAVVGALSGWSVRRIMVATAREVAFPWHDEFVLRPLAFDVRFRSVPELVLGSPEFDFDNDQSGPGVIYAGPCVCLNRREPEFDWSWLRGDQRLVYFSMGTVARRLDETTLRLARELAAAFGDDPSWAALLAIPDKSAVASLHNVSANVRVVNWAPQLASLRRASAVVTHGGHNSVKECLLLGVPMVVYPRAADQFGNSARILFHGVGVRGSPRSDRRGEIRRAVESVADDTTIRANLDAIAAALRKDVHAERAVRELLRMASPPQPKSTLATPAGNSPART
jgi:zeaxanthin glucosyltransferase